MLRKQRKTPEKNKSKRYVKIEKIEFSFLFFSFPFLQATFRKTTQSGRELDNRNPKLTYSDRGESKHQLLILFLSKKLECYVWLQKASNNGRNIETHRLAKTERWNFLSVFFSFPPSSFLIIITCRLRKKHDGDGFLGDSGFRIQRVSVVRLVWVNSVGWPNLKLTQPRSGPLIFDQRPVNLVG